jgi:hypothetical protein
LKKRFGVRHLPDPAVMVLVAVLQLVPLKRSRAEDRIDFKTLFYQEDNDRMRVFAPTFEVEHDVTPTLTIRLEGIYNAISGASPTGAPPTASPSSSPPAIQPSSPSGDASDQERESRALNPGLGLNQSYPYLAGATPTTPPATTPAQPSPSTPPPATTTPDTSQKVPTAHIEDERLGLNLGITKRLDRHAVSADFAYSTESDYDSYGLALRDAIDFNKKNTTLLIGGAFTHDIITPTGQMVTETKNTMDAMVGLTQLLDKRTFFTVNLALGRAEGFLNDPYKVVELNGTLVPERRPEDKTKQIVYMSLTRFIERLDGSLEASYRWYDDTFGIQANTVGLAWFQKLGPHFVLRPDLRWYDQGAADFYGASRAPRRSTRRTIASPPSRRSSTA